MQLYYDLRLSQLVSALGSNAPLRTINFKRGDDTPVVIQFVRGLTGQELASGATGIIGLKAQNDFDGEFLAAATSWTKTGEGAETLYTFDLNLNTTAINDLLGVGEEDDVQSVQVNFELEFVESGRRTSSQIVTATIENDVVRGGEEPPTTAPQTVLYINGPQDLTEEQQEFGRDNLALGSASTQDTGTDEGNVPILGEGGKLDPAVIPSLALTGSLLVDNAAARIALTEEQARGQAIVEADTGDTYMLVTDGDPSETGDWIKIGDRDVQIAEVSGLQTALDTKQTKTEVRDTSFTAAVDAIYTAVATLTVTDPGTPVEGKPFTVIVRNGTATVGGTAYATAGTIIRRIYHSGSYTNYVYKNLAQLPADLAAAINAASEGTPVDADEMGYRRNSDGLFVKVTLANLFAYILTKIQAAASIVFTGQLRSSNQTAATGDALMTRDLGDVRYYQEVAAFKPNNETKSSTTTMTPDADLIIPVAANSVYLVEAYLPWVVSVGGTAGFKVGILAPSGSSRYLHVIGSVSSLTTLPFRASLTGDSSFSDTPAGNASVNHAEIKGTVRTFANAGNIQIQWAQGVAENSTTLRALSSLKVTKIA